MLLAFAAIYFALSAFDTWLTRRRIADYGVNVELNASIRLLCTKLGTDLGAILGVMVPSCALIALSILFHLQWVLAILIGFRGRAFYSQLLSLKFEKQLKEFMVTNNLGGVVPPRAPLPRDPGSTAGKENMPPTPSSEEYNETDRQ